MRHLNQGRKLNRTSSHRKALFRNLVLSLIEHERIKTTDAKAKELRRYADRMVTLGKRGDLSARRLAFAFIQSRDAVKKLFDEIAPRFKDRAGGYTRVVKYGVRRGDAAPLSIIEFTGTSEKAATRKTPQEKGRGPPRRRSRAFVARCGCRLTPCRRNSRAVRVLRPRPAIPDHQNALPPLDGSAFFLSARARRPEQVRRRPALC